MNRQSRPIMLLKPALAGVLALLAAGCGGTTADPVPQASTAAAPPTAPSPAAATPCDAGQTVVFSCATGAESAIALCGSPDHARLTYHESGPAAAPDWPADDTPAATAFRAGTLMFSGGGGAFLRFDRDGQAHTVYTGIGRGWEKAGLVVQDGERTVRELTCDGEVVSQIGPGLFEQAAIPTDPAGFVIP